MKVTLRHAFENYGSLDSLSRKNLPALISFRISKAMRTIRPEVEAFDKARSEIIKANGVEDELGNWKPKKDSQEKVEQEIIALLDEEFEIEVTPINAGLFEKLEISPLEISAISFMIEGEL